MIRNVCRTLPLVVAFAAMTAHAQFNSSYFKDHGASISFGATGQFSTELTTNPNSGLTTVPRTGFTTQGVSNAQQFTTDSVGFVTSFQFHPKPWAGIEMNYGFTHYSERFTFNYANTAALQQANVLTDAHEATAAYQFHPKRIPFQPFVNVGGGAIDFAPYNASSQIRGAGLLEVGFDLPTHNPHFGFRVEGRSLYYRAPNFYTPQISSGSWRVTEEPSFSSYYHF